jgi:hypothetical protein
MTAQELIDMYHNAALMHCNEWEVDNPHVIQVCQSVMMTRDKFLIGGSFVQSVVENNLSKAVSFADSTCFKNLKVIVDSKHVYIEKNIYNEEGTIRTGILD